MCSIQVKAHTPPTLGLVNKRNGVDFLLDSKSRQEVYEIKYFLFKKYMNIFFANKN